MALKQVFAPHLGRNVKFGRNRPSPDKRAAQTLRLGAYFGEGSIPSPPSSCDYSDKAAKSLTNVLLNDQLGDCVVAAGYHAVGVQTGNAGALFVPTHDQVITDYSAIGGYVPGNESTDNGCDELTALEHWKTHGFADGSKPVAYLGLSATNRAELMNAIYLFEHILLGCELPDAWVNPIPSRSGFTWGVAGVPDPQNGHAIMAMGYNLRGVCVDTWGMTGLITWEAIGKYFVPSAGGDIFVLLSQDQLLKGQQKDPHGLDWATLISDFNALGGSVPVPDPVVTPTPTPTPASKVTQAQAIQWATGGLGASKGMITKAQATAAVTSGLSNHWPRG